MKNILLLIAIAFVSGLYAQKEEKKIANIHTGNITALVVSADGTRALTGGSDSRANLWSTLNGNKLKGFAAQDKEITDVRFNNDESLFASASKNMSIVIWDGATQKPKKILKETAEILAIDFDPFSNNLISVSSSGSLKLWDAVAGKSIRDNFAMLDEKEISVATVRYARDGKYIVVQANEKIYIFKKDGSLVAGFSAAKSKAGKQCFGLSPDGKLLAFKTPSGQISLALLELGKVSETLPGDYKSISVISFGQNAKTLLLGGDAGKLTIYDVSAKSVTKEFAAHNGAILGYGISLDGKTLITVGTDLVLKRWDISTLNFGYLQQPEIHAENAGINKLVINDENQNGLLDAGEKVSINATVNNTSTKPLYDGILELVLEAKLDGLDIPTSILVGNLLPGANKTVTIPVANSAQLASGSTTLNTELKSGGVKQSDKSLSIQTGSSINAGVAVRSYKFYSPSGKSAKGEPITMVLTIENITRIVAENVQVFYKFPVGVSAIDKSKEVIARIAPGAVVTTSVQFMADKSLASKDVTLGLDISGVAYSNSADLKMVLPLDQAIGTQQDMLASLENKPASSMRGSLTISKEEVSSASIENARYIALVIGIDNYAGSWNKLQNAVHDAQAVEEVLKKSYNFSIVHTLYDKAATRQAIISEFEWLVANLKPTDNLVIFYSGHGDYKESLNRGFWVPVDAASNSTSNFISNPDLQTFLASIKTKHTLLISDACFSGDIFRGGDQKEERGELNEKYFNRVNNLSSRQAITSGGIEPVMDGGKDGHSVFTYYLLKALKDNHQKYMDAGQIFDAIKIPVVNNSSQAPKFSPIKNAGDEGGEFIFMMKQK